MSMPHPTDSLTDEACRLIARRAFDHLYVNFSCGENYDEAIVDRDHEWDWSLHEELAETLRNYGLTPPHGHDDEDWDESLAPRVEVN